MIPIILLYSIFFSIHNIFQPLCMKNHQFNKNAYYLTCFLEKKKTKYGKCFHSIFAQYYYRNTFSKHNFLPPSKTVE